MTVAWGVTYFFTAPLRGVRSPTKVIATNHDNAHRIPTTGAIWLANIVVISCSLDSVPDG